MASFQFSLTQEQIIQLEHVLGSSAGSGLPAELSVFASDLRSAISDCRSSDGNNGSRNQPSGAFLLYNFK
jgi:hypothetical protein